MMLVSETHGNRVTNRKIYQLGMLAFVESSFENRSTNSV